MLAALPLFPLRAVRVNAERYVGIRARNLPTGYDCQLLNLFPINNFYNWRWNFALSQATEIQSKMSAFKVIKNISG
jgi:hypothetical protein